MRCRGQPVGRLCKWFIFFYIIFLPPLINSIIKIIPSCVPDGARFFGIYHAVIVLCGLYGRRFFRIVPRRFGRFLICDARGAAPDPGIFQGMTDAPNEVFSRISKRGRAYLRCSEDNALVFLRRRRSHPSGYPSAGCVPAEPASVWPESFRVVSGFLVGGDEGLLRFFTGVVPPVGLHEHGVDFV